jgi:hypothetical protein
VQQVFGGYTFIKDEKQKTHPEGCVFHHVMQNLPVRSYEDTRSIFFYKTIAFPRMQEATGELTQLSSQRFHKRLCCHLYITGLCFCQVSSERNES